MAKEDQQIMVIPRGVLFNGNKDAFNGFYNEIISFEARVLNNYIYMRRGDAENNPGFKQPIGYCTIINPTLKKILAYQRSSKDDKYSEKRLQGKWSIGIGGHIEKADASGNPIAESLNRELGEEIDIEGAIKKISPIGYINDDNDSVGKVHFGILYAAETDAVIGKPKDGEMSRCGFFTISELEAIFSSPENQVETWSRIAFEELKRRL